jgi:hypothetical protein
MRVFFARPPKGVQGIIVDSRGRARLARTAIVTPKAIGLAAACALLAVAPETGPGARLIAAGQSAAKSAADYIRARSPGLRTRAELFKIKHPYARPKRTARALPRHRRPAAPPPALIAPPPSRTFAGSTPTYAPPEQPAYAGPLTGWGQRPGVPCCFEGFNPPLTTAVGGIFGGGGGGPGPPPPAVPEPSAWALMILGFGIVGTAWRRRRALLQVVRALPRLTHQRMLLLAYARAG